MYSISKLIIPMEQYRDEISYQGYKFFDITQDIQKIIAETMVITGRVSIHTLHTTCTVAVQEYEKGLVETDFLTAMKRIAPVTEKAYTHNNLKLRKESQVDPKLDPSGDECLDGHAHCHAFFLPQAVLIHIEHGKMVLGQWQSILFVGLNEITRKERTVSVHIDGIDDEVRKTTYVMSKK